MLAEYIIAALLVTLVVGFLLGEQYGRHRESDLWHHRLEALRSWYVSGRERAPW
jgi:hypothetical protein